MSEELFRELRELIQAQRVLLDHNTARIHEMEIRFAYYQANLNDVTSKIYKVFKFIKAGNPFCSNRECERYRKHLRKVDKRRIHNK